MIDTLTLENTGTQQVVMDLRLNLLLATPRKQQHWMIAAQREGTAGNTNLVFGTNSTERMRILSSGGLTFNGDTAQAQRTG